MTTWEHLDAILAERGAWFQAQRNHDDDNRVHVLYYRSRQFYGHGSGETSEEAVVDLLSNLGRLSRDGA